ncbi:VCP [Lepeophtheirus salmonis]|uniref:VCP n=1 Tax=Lepeophtheirus salmonis TaxID=72036 RepID=A0A7R8CM32_LEPSM|nr:VCP [Lepeophtheirus salmonis]CAF2862799.1 VCP [Lepeophtheirus salmonis]
MPVYAPYDGQAGWGRFGQTLQQSKGFPKFLFRGQSGRPYYASTTPDSNQEEDTKIRKLAENYKFPNSAIHWKYEEDQKETDEDKDTTNSSGLFSESMRSFDEDESRTRLVRKVIT